MRTGGAETVGDSWEEADAGICLLDGGIAMALPGMLMKRGDAKIEVQEVRK